jgi:amino acid adenylation domain-containing protein
MSRDDRGRLTPGERALWFLQRLAPAGGAYNLAGAVRIADLDAAALRRALVRLAARHAALRTTYPAVDGEPCRREVDFTEVDLFEVDLADEPDALRHWMEAEAVRPFDPETGPLWRVRLAGQSGGERAVLFVFHHLIADFWSLAVILRELGALYGEETGGQPAGLAVESASYAEWMEHRERALATPRGERLLAFWRDRLAGPVPHLSLPVDRPRTAAPSGAGEARTARLDEAATARLLTLGRAHGATFFAVLFAAFQLLLRRLSGLPADGADADADAADADIWIGVPTIGRSGARWAGTVGYFVNPVVMRGRSGGAAAFGALVDAASREAQEALAHRDQPFPLLAAELQPDRESGRSPLFQAMLTLHRARRPEEETLALLALGEGGGRARFSGLDLETLPLRRHAAQIDLALAAAVMNGELRLRLEVDTDLFDGTTADRLLGHLLSLLSAAELDTAPAGALPLLGEAERQAVLSEWNDTAAEAGLETATAVSSTVLSLFAARLREAPDAPAVLWNGRPVRTRRSLARRAARLAAVLGGLGAGPGTVVGLCLDRSPELVEAVLGVLATGAAYLPLDPAYPRAYLAHAVEDSAVSLVLTREALRSALPETRGRVVVLPASPEELEETAEERRLPELPPGDPAAPAYLLYTSGSTGRPKGIPVSHRSLARYLAWVLEGPLAGIDGIPCITAPGFDASLKQLFGPLVGGFPVRLMEDETVRRPERLLAALRGHGRLALNCVPSVWRAVLDALEGEHPGESGRLPLARLLLGGESFDRALLDRTFRLLPDLEVWNLYGPTEATANAAAARLAPGEPVTIGRPVAGARLYVVDGRLAPLPRGIAGELVLGGPGLAPGYWRQPGLTAERFVPDPFSRVPGARLYRTGDRARHRAGGTVELLGRIDFQLKVRGLRVEPAEIEAALLAHPAVVECVVGVLGGRLAAWIVPGVSGASGGSSVLPTREGNVWRRHLEARLPAAMVPAAFFVLDALPRTPAGKVDREALLRSGAGGAAGPFKNSPRSPREEVLAAIWAEVLGVEHAGVRDDFFAAGGHSLLAARLLARVRNIFGVELPLRALFAAPTVSGLAAAVAAAVSSAAPLPVVPPVVPVPGEERVCLSFAQERLWLIDQWMPDSPAYNIPLAVRLRGALDVPALAAALATVVRRHEALRTTFSAIAGLPVQVFRGAAATALPEVDLAALGEREREAAAAALEEAEARRPFDLRNGPLLRACLLRLGPEEHILLLSLHHIVSDGWSMGLLISELKALYPALRAGRNAVLPPLPVQYADFAAWQRRRSEDSAFARDIAWWRACLAGAPAVIDLLTDRPRPAWSIHRGALLPFRLTPEHTARLRTVARHGGATLFMSLLAAFQAVLGRLSGAEDLVIGSAVDQRTPEVEDLIGFFVNLLALRGDLSGDPSFSALLTRARGAVLNAHDHRDVPFEKLVAEIEPVRHPGRNPLFQVAFSLQSSPLPELSLPGLTLKVRELETGTARFDLTLLLREADGGVAGILEHSTDLFDTATVRRLLSTFETLLAAAVADPSLPLSRLPLLGAAERRQVVEEWGQSAGRADRTPREVCLDALFAHQVERSPNAVAVAVEGREVSYRELAGRAAVLAAHLRTLGVGPDIPVAVCLERSLDMVTSLVGIVQAGGAYVPLDLAYPRERLAWMLADSGARIAVSRGAILEKLRAGSPDRALQVVDLDLLDLRGEAPRPLPRPDLRPDLHPGNLAYIVYTSGSTGQPKGVAATHRGVVRLVVDPGYVDLGPEETLLQLAPVLFDASTFEIWGALVNGGRLAIYPPGPVALRELGETLRRERVTTLFLTTGLFHQMVDEELASLAGLRQLLTGGDVISVARVRRVLEALPALRLIHAYGPTEATTFATCRTVTAADAARPALTLGRPIPRTSVHILDRGMEPVPPGVPGELWLGGDGLARGYRGQPAMTALRFVPSPFPLEETGGERLYRTGDLARWLPDGTVDFLGRIDRQVKIRGFRVEPAEVEATLESHPGIAACVVLPRGEAEDKRLVAWVVSALSPALSPALSDTALLTWCRDRLPAFLVPAVFVRIDAVPLDRNGKVDRRALPEPDRSRRADAYVAPRTPVEERVAAVWAEILGLDRVGAEDDFFLLGGHSLLATQIVSRLSRDFDVGLSLRAFFEEPTVSGVALAITREQMRQGDPERMAVLLARVQGLSPEELADLLRESRD